MFRKNISIFYIINKRFYKKNKFTIRRCANIWKSKNRKGDYYNGKGNNIRRSTKASRKFFER